MTDTDTEDEVRRMTVPEIALMRAIVHWRKAHEIEFVRRRVMGTYWVDSFGRTARRRRSVAIELKDEKFGTSGGSLDSYEWHGADTVSQAVDVLVAYRYLPSRFSSAYRAALSDMHREASGHDDRMAVDRTIHALGGYYGA